MFKFMKDVMQLNLNYAKMNGPIYPPEWTNAYKVIWSDGKTEMLEFRKGRKPIVIVAPEAGHGSQLVDWPTEGNSLVRCALDNTNYGVYVLNKLPATEAHKYLVLEYCFTSLEECLDLLNGPVHLIGLCQGGTASAVVAARVPWMIERLIIAGAPMKTSACDSSLTPFLDKYPQEAYEEVVRENGGFMPGELMLMGFLADKPNTFRYDETYRWSHSDDPKFVEADRVFRNWYYTPQAQAGPQYLETLTKGFRDNIGNHYNLHGDYSVDLIAGTTDPICPAPQVFGFKDYCPQAVCHTVEAGHIGLFMGKKAVKTIWTELFRSL